MQQRRRSGGGTGHDRPVHHRDDGGDRLVDIDLAAADDRVDGGGAGAEIITDYAGRETAEGTVLSVPAEVLSDFDDDQLRPDAESTVAEVLEVVEFYPSAPVEVVGHTDSEGDPGYNQRLSERRAQAVGAALEAAGVDAGRISTVGRGEDAPVADNGTEEGRQANRRVEVLLRGVEPPETD